MTQLIVTSVLGLIVYVLVEWVVMPDQQVLENLPLSSNFRAQMDFSGSLKLYATVCARMRVHVCLCVWTYTRLCSLGVVSPGRLH